MPRSSFSKNPLLRVSRPISACSRCRTAKVKCDGKLPACTACQKAGREDECSSANDQFARGKERSYVAALELRIEKLERRLQYAKSRKASVANYPEPETTATSPDDGSERRDSLASIRDAIHRKAARTRENSDVNSLVSDFGFMSVNATTRDFEPMGNMTFARLVLAATLNDPVPPSVEINVPPRQATNAIVNHFLANIYTLYPCFSEMALWTVIDDFYKQDNRMIKESDYWLMFMVLAIGSAAQSKTLHDAYYDTGVEYLAKALQHADRALAPGNVTQIQSLLLLTIYSMLDPAHFDTWHLIGFTARAVIDLGLHQDPPSSTLDRAALDMRRRIFYCTYAMDRAVSMVHARTFSFTDETTSVAFPSATNSKDSISRKPSETGPITAPQSADPSLLLFQLRRAQSFWYQELYQSDSTPLADPTSFLWQMCLDMREWGESLPVTLPPGIRRMFDQELRYSYVYCIAPSVRAPQITDYTRSLIFEHALEYLNVMHEIAHTDLNSALYTYHDALKVYFMGNQFLAVIRDAEDVILSGRPVATPPSRPGCPPPPPIPRRHVQPMQSPAEMIQKSLRCLQCIPQTLAKYGERWEEAVMLMQSFQQLSKDMVAHLQNRQANASSVPQQQPQQLHQQQQHLVQQQQQQQMQQMNAMQYQAMPPNMQGQQPWVGINVSQMMHGGPPR